MTDEIRDTLDKEHPWSLALISDRGWVAMWQYRNADAAMAKRGKVRKALDTIGGLILGKITACDYGFRLEIAAGV